MLLVAMPGAPSSNPAPGAGGDLAAAGQHSPATAHLPALGDLDVTVARSSQGADTVGWRDTVGSKRMSGTAGLQLGVDT